MHREEKVQQLHTILYAYGRVAVAFSGGVDSSLLLKCALDTLGAGNVLVLNGRSCLVGPEEHKRAAGWPARHGFIHGIELLHVDMHPLTWKEFTPNPKERCYLCKTRMYKQFIREGELRGFTVLVDGTNTDDLKDQRPGLRAIHELNVQTPLVAAGFDKEDVRACSRKLNLDSWQQPSASCLATRIPHGMTITEERLTQIYIWEAGLARMGFSGCRVRMDSGNRKRVLVEVQQADMENLLQQGTRLTLQRFFQKSGIDDVYVHLVGRR